MQTVRDLQSSRERQGKTSTCLSEQDDSALGALARGNREALSVLYERYVERVYRFVFARIGDVQDAQDVTSQVFLVAVESIDRYTGRGEVGGWLFAIARHKVADYYRRRPAAMPIDGLELAENGPSVEAIADARLTLARVVRALRSLDEQQAEAVALRVFGGLRAREVGEAMGKSEAAAKMLVYRGLRRLQERLARVVEVSL
jgi:RNA polymerase sigma-70 factor (ECF subfamily)